MVVAWAIEGTPTIGMINEASCAKGFTQVVVAFFIVFVFICTS
jgi:hypothetical protein